MGGHATRDEMLDALGPFSVVFEPIGDDTTPHLSLLHLRNHASVVNVTFLVLNSETPSHLRTLTTPTLLAAVWWLQVNKKVPRRVACLQETHKIGE